MSKLKKFFPENEKELHIIIQEELDSIEEGLELLQHEYTSVKGIIDFLCSDSGGRLVIIEVKLHEDENILFQALRYYSDIERNRYSISSLFKGKHINPEESPRVILIAEKFSEDLRRLSTLVVPEVELFEYSSVFLPDGQRSIVFHPVTLPTEARLPSEPSTIEKLMEYLKDDNLKPLVNKIRHEIKNIGKGIEEYATQGYIGYKYTNGRQFAYIRPNRKSIEFGAHIIDEKKQLLDYESEVIDNKNTNYDDTMEKVKISFVNLGGKLES
jgi:hypothetical protein